MRQTRSIVFAAAAILLAGTTLAGAQGTGNEQKGAAPAPSAQQKAPAERTKPGGAMQQHPGGTTGQGGGMSQQAPGGTQQRPGSATQQRPGGTTGQNQREPGAQQPGRTTGQGQREPGAQQNQRTQEQPRGGAQQRGGAQMGGQQRPGATTGQGAAGARANLSTEQQTRIRTVIKENVHVQPLTRVNFAVSVGTRVPRDVHFYPLPAEVVTVYPAWRGFNFVLVNEQIVVIDPSTYEIVAVLPA